MNISKALAIDGWMFPDELEWLAEVASKSQLILEIGSYLGRSTRALGDNTKGEVICIDPWVYKSRRKQRHYKKFQQNLADLLATGTIKTIQATSDQAFPAVRDRYGKTFDLIFIDGDHSYDVVRQDIQQYQTLVRLGGILSGHDYHHVKHPGVKQAVDELLTGVSLVHSIWWVQI